MAFNLSTYFTGSEQSRIAAIAIVVAIVAIVLSIVFSNTDLSFGDRVGLSVFVILFSLPSILFALFDLTCISSNTKINSPCWYYGWILSLFIIVIAIIVVINSVMSMIAYNDATIKSSSKSVSQKDADSMAKDILNEETDSGERMNETVKGEVGYGSQFGPLMENFSEMKKEKEDEKRKIEGFMNGGEYASVESLSGNFI